MLLTAREEGDRIVGDVYAVLDRPLATIAAPLADPREWCELLLLPVNTQNCEASGNGLALLVARKYSTPIEFSHRLAFRFEAARGGDDLRVRLQAPTGPFGTRDYDIVFEVVALDARRSFMHLRYAYGYGTAARIGMQAYLSTAGASKVGFTVEGSDAEGRTQLVRGMRGVMERNTMRHFLAIEAYLHAAGLAPRERAMRMAEEWHAGIERYPRQLREIERDEYLKVKLAQYERMRSALSPARRTASSSP